MAGLLAGGFGACAHRRDTTGVRAPGSQLACAHRLPHGVPLPRPSPPNNAVPPGPPIPPALMTTSMPTVYSFPEFHRVACAVADHVVAAQNATLLPPPLAPGTPALPRHQRQGLTLLARKKDRRFKIAISGGSLLRILAEGLLPRKDVSWGLWDVYFVDERMVPFGLDELNFGQAKRLLFDHLSDKPRVYAIDETLTGNAEECAEDYGSVLIDNFARKNLVKLPQMDLVLLGCAPDGHVALLFPGDPALREQLDWVLPILKAPSGPEERITLSIPVLTHAQRVTFVVEGATKAKVVKTIMERPEKGLPASIVNERAAGRVTWFVDEAALSDVEVRRRVYKEEAPEPLDPASTSE